MSRPLRKAVLVHGVRTPFVKSFGDLYNVDATGLGVASVGGLIKKANLDPKHIDRIIWGNVVVQVSAPNVGREIVIDLNLPKHIVAETSIMQCASGLLAISQAQQMIETGNADVVIAGGSDSLSSAEVAMPRAGAQGLAMSFVYAPKKWGIMKKLKNFGKMTGWKGKNLVPQPPAVSERSTGKSMGYHADLMAELNNVDRAAQEEWALRSHRNAYAAQQNGILADEIVPCTNGQGDEITRDNIIQPDLEKMAKKMPSMKAAFRKPHGTVTAATSSALTDGGSCVLVMSEEKAKELGYPTDITMSACAFTGIDPYPQLLMAPALGIPKALKKAGLEVKDIDRWEIHEAFSAQVLSTLAALENDEFCNRQMGHGALPKIEREKINVNGSSIAIGHPFAATGGRLVVSAMNELRRSQKKHALLSICAAGGLGGVGIISRA